MLTQKQKEKRQFYLGASDINTLCNPNSSNAKYLKSYKKAVEKLFEEKFTGNKENDSNIYAIGGNVIEEKLQEKLNIINLDELDFKNNENGNIVAHVDGFLDNSIVEIKATKNDINEAVLAYDYQLQAIMFASNTKTIKLINYQRKKGNVYFDLMSNIHKKIGFKVYEENLESVEDFIKEEFEENKFEIDQKNIEKKIIEIDEKKIEKIKNTSKLFWDFINLSNQFGISHFEEFWQRMEFSESVSNMMDDVSKASHSVSDFTA